MDSVLLFFKFETGPEISQVVSLLHSDLHDDSSVSLLEHCVSSILTLKKSPRSTYAALCSTEHKKSTGKVVKIVSRRITMFQYFKIILLFY